MKPVTESAGAMTTASDPPKVGREREQQGGATAPVQNAEHALQDECESFAASVLEVSSSATLTVASDVWPS